MKTSTCICVSVYSNFFPMDVHCFEAAGQVK